MQNLKDNAAHMVMAIVAITAMIVLDLHGSITGQEAFGGVLVAAGFSLGAGSASGSPTTVTAANPAGSASVSTTPTAAPAPGTVEPANVTTLPTS